MNILYTPYKTNTIIKKNPNPLTKDNRFGPISIITHLYIWYNIKLPPKANKKIKISDEINFALLRNIFDSQRENLNYLQVLN